MTIKANQADRDAAGNRRLYLELDRASCRTNWQYEAKKILEPYFTDHRQATLEEAAKVADIFARQCDDGGDFGPGRSPSSCYRYVAEAIRALGDQP